MHFLNSLKGKVTMSRNALQYTERSHKIYKQVISEAKKRENDRVTSHAKNSTKRMWQIIKKTGKSLQDIWLKNGRVEISHLQDAAESFNSYFIDKVYQFVGMDRFRIHDQNSQAFMNNNHSSTFLFPVSEEVVKVVSKLQGKTSAGFDEIPEFLVKECIQNIKKTIKFHI
jgi:hypothetical protein